MIKSFFLFPEHRRLSVGKALEIAFAWYGRLLIRALYSKSVLCSGMMLVMWIVQGAEKLRGVTGKPKLKSLQVRVVTAQGLSLLALNGYDCTE
jgi:hypothetical protein